MGFGLYLAMRGLGSWNKVLGGMLAKIMLG